MITATLNSAPLLKLRVQLRRGAEAATLEAETAAPPPAPGDDVLIRVADAGSSREFRQFRVTRVERLSDGRARVHGADIRADWAQRPLRLRLATTTLDAALRRLFDAARAGAPPAVPALALPAQPVNAPLNVAVARALAACNLGFTIDDTGEVRVAGLHEAQPAPARVIAHALGHENPAAAVAGGEAIELIRVSDFEAVLPGDGTPGWPAGALFPLADLLAAWGIAENAARRAALGDAGFERLLGPTTSAMRLEILRRHAFRMFRAVEPRHWLPVGGMHGDAFAPPRLEAAGTRPAGSAPARADETGFADHGLAPVREGFAVDCARNVVRLAHPPYLLGPGDVTLQSRALIGPPRLRLTIAVASDRAPFRTGDGPAISAPHLVALYDGANLVNAAQLRARARQLLLEAAQRAEYSCAGVADDLALGARALVEITADARGLLSRVVDAPAPALEHAPEPPPQPFDDGPAPLPAGLHQPINAWRAGPLVLRAAGNVPETESAIAAEAAGIDPRTGALELGQIGPLAFPWFADSRDSDTHGRWFFVAGVEVADGLRIPGDARHEAAHAPDFAPVRHQRPRGLRGLLVGTPEGPQFVDAGPLVADARGRTPGACSNLVADVDGENLSELRRGGLQYVMVLALSPVHRRWVPALNLRDGDTQNPATCGRGLFAERDGRVLGRLAAHNQGGPVFADDCAKHAFGSAVDDGLNRECAGHISTEAFFKVPGDDEHDAPLRFYELPFAGGVPPWRPYEAQIRFDAQARHRFDHGTRPGMWRIQYRVPFLPEIPPTWRPPRPPIEPPEPPPEVPPPHVPVMILPPEAIPPIISENEIWAPSHDWIPAPSEPEPERDVPMTGPAVSAAGWAAETDGAPDASLGGGCIYLPPGLHVPTAQQDRGPRKTFVALHPEVLLGFGLPHHGLGRVHSGWQVGLNDGALEFTPVDADADATDGTLRVHGEAAADAIAPAPRASSPGDGRLWADSGTGKAMWGSHALVTADVLALLAAEVAQLRADLDACCG